ncbi:MAG: hypothetical protein V3V49_07250 [Candidatus Krumholzibacteria bacterium]
MPRKKPPVLTSPWKVGFFVSLMLVSLGIGVAYFFMRTFELSWGLGTFEASLAWLKAEVWGNPAEHKGLLFRIWPLLVMVGVTALLSHMVIARAVRKYKSYLESGLDYKNLLSSLREIHDLEDKKQISRLKNHPELKRFLMRVRDKMAEQTKEMDQFEDTLEKEVEEAEKAKEKEITGQFADQCEALVGAIRKARPGHFLGDPAVKAKELKRVEDALCEAFQSAGSDPAMDQQTQDGLAEVVKELEENTLRAREIEKHITALAGAAAPSGGDGVQVELQGIAASLQSLEGLNTTVRALSEDTKGIAINTALQASSGEVGQAELVQLAETMKEIAAKFSDTAKSYGGIAASMKKSIGDLEGQVATGSGAPGAGLSKTVNSIADKVAVLGARTSLLADKISKFQNSHTPSSSALKAAGDDGRPTVEDDYGFEKVDSRKPLFSESETTESARGSETDGVLDAGDDEEEMFADLSEKKAPASVSEPESEVFRESTPLDAADVPGVDASAMPSSLNEIDLGGNAGHAPPPKPAKSAPPKRAPAPKKASKPAPPKAAEKPAPRKAAKKPPARPAPPEPRPVADVSGEDINVNDLYAIGAVDFDPALHG